MFQQFGDRKYLDSDTVFKKHVIKLLKRMNDDKEFNHVNGDQGFVYTMLNTACEQDLNSRQEICSTKMALMKGRFFLIP